MIQTASQFAFIESLTSSICLSSVVHGIIIKKNKNMTLKKRHNHKKNKNKNVDT